MIGAAHAGVIAAATPRSVPVPVGTWYRFDASGAEEEWVVPAGVTAVRAYVVGASGGGGIYGLYLPSAAGGYSVGDIAVTPGETLRIRVGTGGGAPNRAATSGGVDSGGAGGWPGGGSGSYGDTWGGGGGGYSGIFRDDETPIIIAGGGGGTAGYVREAGGGGGTVGGETQGAGNAGGTQSAGGVSSGGMANGSYLQGASADNGNRFSSTGNDGGGAGGGYYGGGVGSGDGHAGGGGSGYIGGCTNAATYVNSATNTGSPDLPPAARPTTINGETVAPRGNGVAAVGYGTPANPGNDGVIWLEVI